MKLLLLCCCATLLSGCMAAGAVPVWVTFIGPGLGYVASINNVTIEWLKFTEDKQKVCPVATEAMQPCPTAEVIPPAK